MVYFHLIRKLAKIIPLFKKGNRCDPGNYRQISILSVASTILERIVYKQTNEYLTKSSLIYDFLSGFRKSHSTDTSLLYLTDFIRRQIDKGKMCGMVLLDLQKAFDTVNHSILLDKLSVMGFSSKVIAWLNSYLTGRVQRVEIFLRKLWLKRSSSGKCFRPSFVSFIHKWHASSLW